MSKQRIDYSYIRSLESEIETVSASMTQQVRNLANTIEQLTVDWKGVGGAAYRQAQMSLNEDHDVLRRILDGIKEAVHNTKLGAQSNDSEVLQSMKGIDVNGGAAGGQVTPSGIDRY